MGILCSMGGRAECHDCYTVQRRDQVEDPEDYIAEWWSDHCPAYAGQNFSGPIKPTSLMSFAAYDAPKPHGHAGHHHHPHNHEASAQPAASGEKDLIVYGADWCGWTKRQIAELDKSHLKDKYEFKDCAADDGQQVCAGITGFPTIEIHGKRSPGFKNVDDIVKLL